MPATHPAGIGAPARGFQAAAIALLMAALIVDGLDYQLLALTAPLIMAEWAVSRADFGPAMAAALFGMAFGAAGGGWLGDRIGRLRALALSVALFGLATMAVSRSHDLTALTLLRVLGGVGFGAAGPNALALGTEWAPPRLRTYVIALLAVGTPAGGVIGAAALPLLLLWLDWRGVFAALGVLAIVLALLLLLVLRETPRAATPSAAGRGLFAHRHLRLNAGVGISFAALTAIIYGLGAWMPAFLTAAGLALPSALGASAALNAFSIVGALAAGWLAGSQGSRRVMIACALATAVCLLAFGTTLERAPGAQPLVIAFAAGVGFFASVGITTLYAMTALLYPPNLRSSGIGLGMTASRIGGITMSFAGGYLLDLADGSAFVLFGVLALCAMAATTAGWLVRAHVASRAGDADTADRD